MERCVGKGIADIGSRELILSQITSASQLNKVIFKDKAAVSPGKKFFSLFPGLGYAAGYKVNMPGMFGLVWF